jgi:hypothetical protein
MAPGFRNPFLFRSRSGLGIAKAIQISVLIRGNVMLHHVRGTEYEYSYLAALRLSGTASGMFRVPGSPDQPRRAVQARANAGMSQPEGAGATRRL